MDSVINVISDVIKNDLPEFVGYLTIPILVEGLLFKLIGKKYSLKEGPATIFIGLVEVTVTGVCLFYLRPVFSAIEAHSLFTIPRGPLYWIALALVCEFIFFYAHWIAHHVRWFWNEHQVHHSSLELNLFAGNRNGWTFLLAGAWIFILPFIFLGFGWRDIVAGYFLILNYQFFIHTELIKKLGPLEYILNTPSLHRVHHAVQDRYVDKNFGGVTVLFDYLFGTLQREIPDVRPEYGLREAPGRRNSFHLVFDGWLGMVRDFFRTGSVKSKLSALYKMKRVSGK